MGHTAAPAGTLFGCPPRLPPPTSAATHHIGMANGCCLQQRDACRHEWQGRMRRRSCGGHALPRLRCSAPAAAAAAAGLAAERREACRMGWVVQSTLPQEGSCGASLHLQASAGAPASCRRTVSTPLHGPCTPPTPPHAPPSSSSSLSASPYSKMPTCLRRASSWQARSASSTWAVSGAWRGAGGGRGKGGGGRQAARQPGEVQGWQRRARGGPSAPPPHAVPAQRTSPPPLTCGPLGSTSRARPAASSCPFTLRLGSSLPGSASVRCSLVGACVGRRGGRGQGPEAARGQLNTRKTSAGSWWTHARSCKPPP